MAELAAREVGLIQELRRSRVLQDTDFERLDVRRGLITVICGDGDQSYDKLGHLWRSQGKAKSAIPPRIHILALNGAPLYIVSQSPAERQGLTSGETLRRQVWQSASLKGIDAVALIGHAPCGHANTCGIGVMDELVLLQCGKRELVVRYPSLRVAAFLHVDFSRSKKRTYFVDRVLLEKYIARVMLGDIAVAQS